jgi:hypothetical protein
MALDYNPISFKQIDLRKYHVRDLQDVVKFAEFCISRLEEVRQVTRTNNNKLTSLNSLLESYKKQSRETIAAYGNPNYQAKPVEEVKVETIKPAEATSVEAEHKELLDELKSTGNDADERRVAELEVDDHVYRATNGKKRVMFYKDGRLTKDENVPEETREELIAILGKATEE